MYLFQFQSLNYLSQFVRLLLFLTSFTCGSVLQVECLNFSYPAFYPGNETDFSISRNSMISNNAIQVTPNSAGQGLHLSNLSGRVFFREQLQLWDSQRGMKASFKSTFVFNIHPITSPCGDGLAFVLAANSSLPDHSARHWLGIVNASSIGISNIVAVEFDTRKSYPEDVDDNHVGVDVRSIYSIQQEPLGAHGVNLSSGNDMTATVYFDAESGKMGIFVSTSSTTETPILTVDLDLSKLLPEDVFVGFSASTGTYTQLNTIKSWNFSSWEFIERDPINLIWLWILIPVVVLSGITGFAVMYYRKTKRRKEEDSDDGMQIELVIKSSSNVPHKFQLKQLLFATSNFNSSNKLGKGGFGTVYKGTLNGKDVAVKRISADSRHGRQDFIAEITTIGNLNQKNLVKLIGWCYEKSELLLVYEFMPNGSLDKFILSAERPLSTEDQTLSWERRHIIMCGVAQALDYLHNGCDKRVLHRDIKLSNVMLDAEFNSRLGDFGLARTIHLNEQTHHSTKEIAGTPGYMAPEIFHTRRAAVETDVFAFGVLMLEVVCGRRPRRQNELHVSIVDWVWKLHSRENITGAVYMGLEGNFDKDHAKRMLELGLACCHPNPYERPSMRTALQVLIGEAAPPFVPLEKPAFIWPARAPRPSNFDTSGSQCTSITELISGR